LTRIDEETSEQLDIIPAQVRVLQHVRFSYACKACEETIKTAPARPSRFPRATLSPDYWATASALPVDHAKKRG
jgi:transposase